MAREDADGFFADLLEAFRASLTPADRARLAAAAAPQSAGRESAEFREKLKLASAVLATPFVREIDLGAAAKSAFRGKSERQSVQHRLAGNDSFKRRRSHSLPKFMIASTTTMMIHPILLVAAIFEVNSTAPCVQQKGTHAFG